MTSDYLNEVTQTISPDFRRYADAGYIICTEPQRTKPNTLFRVRISSKMVAFSLDQPSLNPYPILHQGRNTRNDLILITLDPQNPPLAFVIELKDSKSTRNAPKQIDTGIAFCRFLDEIISIHSSHSKLLRCYGLAIYRPKSRPVGLTRPTFVHRGKHKNLYAEATLDSDLSLSELVRAVGK